MAEEAPIKDDESSPEGAPEPEGALDTPDDDAAEEEEPSFMQRATKGLREASPRKISGALTIILCGLIIAGVGWWVGGISEPKEFERLTYEEAPPAVQEWIDDNSETLFTGRRTIDEHTYVFTTYGRRTREGFGIQVVDVQERVLNVTVYVEFTQPGPDMDNGEMAINYPTDLVRIGVTRFPVTFERLGLP